jgi:uncharacterized protein affecting Mg2+/Co2+ transport
VARPAARVQLKSRHWRIRTIKGELLDEVVGEGVIGAHPVLHAGRILQSLNGTVLGQPDVIGAAGCAQYC